MQIIFVPGPRLERFFQSGLVEPDYLVVDEERAVFLRPADFAGYLSGLLSERSVPHGGVGRVFVWWRDDYEDGECDLEETLVPVTEWMEGGWIHRLDSLVAEVLQPPRAG